MNIVDPPTNGNGVATGGTLPGEEPERQGLAVRGVALVQARSGPGLRSVVGLANLSEAMGGDQRDL